MIAVKYREGIPRRRSRRIHLRFVSTKTALFSAALVCLLAGPPARAQDRSGFVNEAVDGIGSNFDFVVIEVGGDRGADIAFAEHGLETAEWARKMHWP